jgi:hypothetical protein
MASKRHSGENFRALVLGALLGLMTGAVPATDAAPEPPAVGDTWTYRVRDGYSGEVRDTETRRIAAIGGDRIEIEIRRASRPDDFERRILTSAREGVLTRVPNQPVLAFDPPLPEFRFPLQIGERWEQRVRARVSADGRILERVLVQGEVLGVESVETPAGRFEAFKVRRGIWLNDGDYFRTGNHIVETDWYSPAVGAVVRHEEQSRHFRTNSRRPVEVNGDRTVLELTGFHPGNRPAPQ